MSPESIWPTDPAPLASRGSRGDTANPAPVASVFITGSTGFVGSRVLGRINAELRAGSVRLLRSGVAGPEVAVGDLGDPDSYRQRLGPETVVLHLAAITGKAPRRAYYAVNVEGTRALANAAATAGVRGFVFVSSVAARYPDQRFAWYAQSKRAAESVVREAGVPHLIVRPTQVVGEGSPVESALRRLADLPRPLLFGSGRVLVQPIGVEDLAERLIQLLDGPFDGRTITLGGPAQLTMGEWLARLRRRSAARPIRLPVEPLRSVLAALEPVAGRFLPFTAGQMAAFVNDGAAE